MTTTIKEQIKAANLEVIAARKTLNAKNFAVQQLREDEQAERLSAIDVTPPSE